MDIITKTPLFNPMADNITKMFTGDTTGLIDMIEQSIPNFYQKHSEAMFVNNWHPIKIPVVNDKKDLKLLSPDIKGTLEKCMSHLTNLDSLQVHNLPNIASKVRYPEVVGVLSFQEMQESLHSFSYAYIYNSLYSKDEAVRIRDLVRTDPIMRARALELTEAYTSIDDNSLLGQLHILLVNIVLEAIMFYAIFNFFFSLKYQGTMINTATNIAYIKRDEVTHINIFVDILNRFKEDYPEVWDDAEVISFLEAEVDKEIKYSTYILSDGGLGFNEANISMYIKHRANRVFRELGLGTKHYKGVTNPYLHLEAVSAIEDINSTETGIFEVTSTKYFDPYIKIKDFGEFANG